MATNLHPAYRATDMGMKPRVAVHDIHFDAASHDPSDDPSGARSFVVPNRVSVDDLVKEVRAIEANLKRVGLQAKKVEAPAKRQAPTPPVTRTRSNSPAVDARKPWGANTPRSAAVGNNTPATQPKNVPPRASPTTKRSATPTNAPSTSPVPTRPKVAAVKPTTPATHHVPLAKKPVVVPEQIEHEKPNSELLTKVASLEGEVKDLREHNAAMEVALRHLVEQHEQLRGAFSQHITESRDVIHRLQTQLQQATDWIQQVDYHAGHGGALSEASEPEDSFLPTARKLDLSGDSSIAPSRLPPSPPMSLSLHHATQ